MSIKRRYVPKFHGAIEGWVVNHLHVNYWRVANTMQREDLMQEAHCIFLRVASKYSSVDSSQHFMSLFQSAWRNHFTDLAYKDSSQRALLSGWSQVADYEDGSFESLVDAIPGDLENLGYLKTLIEQAPSDIKTVLAFFFYAPDHLVAAAAVSWRGSGKRLALGNKMLCEVLGFPKGTDVIGRVTKYFTP